MVILAFALVLGCFGELNLTLTVPAMPASKALEQLGATAHLTLTTSPQTAEDILTFRLTDVPAQEAMRRIADVDDATWKQEGETFRLIRTDKQARFEREREFNERVSKYVTAIKGRIQRLGEMPAWNSNQANSLASKVQSLLKSFNPHPQTTDWYRQASALSDQAPIARAMGRIIAALDPKELAALPRMLKTVWSMNPTDIQRPMPSNLQSVVEQYVADQNEWSKAIDKWHLTLPTYGNTTYWVGGFSDFNKDAIRTVADVLLTGIPSERGDSVHFELTTYDARGKRIAFAQDGIGYNGPIHGSESKLAAASADEPALTVEGDAKTLAEAIFLGRQSPKRLPPDFLAKLIRPDLYEPVSFLPGSQLLRAAEIKGANMVARLNDEMFANDYVDNTKPMAVDQFLRRLAITGAEYDLKDGWLTVRPDHPLAGQAVRVDRKVLRDYLQRLSSGSALSLDEQARFAVLLPDYEVNSMPSELASVVRSSALTEYFDMNMLRLYGLLTESQKSSMIKDGLSIGSLSSDEMECVKRLVYGPRIQLSYQLPRGSNDSSLSDLYFDGLLGEPTESLPNGLPPEGVIKLKRDHSNVVVNTEPPNARSYTPIQALSPKALAMQKFGQIHQDLIPSVIEPFPIVDLSHLKYGPFIKLTFTFNFTETLSTVRTLEDKSAKGFQPVTLNTLPDDFKQQFDRAYSRLEKTYANVKPIPVSGRNSNIPPQ